MEFINLIELIVSYIVVVHKNAWVSIKYFFFTNVWLFLGLAGWVIMGKYRMDIEKLKHKKPKRKKY